MRRSLRVWFPLLVLAVLCAPASARDAKAPIVRGRQGQDLDEAIQRATKGGFWGAVLVARKEKILLSKGYGHADYGSRANNPTTIFEIASTSKPITAAAILKLAQDGKLKVTDSVKRFFPNIPKEMHAIQVLHLLRHTSGLSNRIGVPYSSPLDRDQYIAHIFQKPRTHEVGAHFAYNNAGYAILAAIVEVASGQSFESYCKQHLFDPAGMKDTGFIQDNRLLKSGRAAARLGPGAAGSSAVNWHWGWGYRGMGGVVTTVQDLYAWDRALRTDKILNKKSRDTYYKAGLSSYACGWQVGTTPTGGTSVSHSGGVQGFRCMYVRLLEDDIVIAVCTNDGNDPHQVAKIAQDMLLPPPRVEATIDATPYTLTKHKGAEWKTGLGWAVSAQGASVAVQLLDPKGRALATLRVPRGMATGVVKQLERAIKIRRPGDAGKPAAAEGGAYLSAYGGKKKFTLTEQLKVVVMPDYNGYDKRATFVLQDAKHGFWPILVKMNVKAAEKLLDLLKKAR